MTDPVIAPTSKRNFRVPDEDWEAVQAAAATGSPGGSEIVRSALHAAAVGVDVVAILHAEVVRRTA